MTKNSNICAVVVTYNRVNMLTKCIEHLLSQEDSSCDIMVIDNASTDGTKEAISAFRDNLRIIYINTGANLGGAGGFQYGIRAATEAGYEFLWVMDDDCMPTSTALNEFIKVDKKLKGNYGFLSSKALWKDGSICTMNVQRHPMYKPIRNFEGDLIPATLASFVSLFFKTEVVRKLGLPIKEFFIWTDDWEYTRRISRHYPCYVVPMSVVIHESVSNIGANIATDSMERINRYRLLYRNDVYMYRREGIRGFLYELVRLSSHILRVILKAKDNRLRRIGSIINGTIEGFSFNPDIEYV